MNCVTKDGRDFDRMTALARQRGRGRRPSGRIDRVSEGTEEGRFKMAQIWKC